MNKCMGLFSTQRLSYEILEIILNVSNATDLETLRTEGFILSVSHWGILAILVFVLYNSCFNFIVIVLSIIKCTQYSITPSSKSISLVKYFWYDFSSLQ